MKSEISILNREITMWKDFAIFRDFWDFKKVGNIRMPSTSKAIPPLKLHVGLVGRPNIYESYNSYAGLEKR